MRRDLKWFVLLLVLLEMKEEAGFERLQPGHLTKLLEDDFWASVSTLHVQKIISSVSELLERLKSCSEDGSTTKHKVPTVQSRPVLLRVDEESGLPHPRGGS